MSNSLLTPITSWHFIHSSGAVGEGLSEAVNRLLLACLLVKTFCVFMCVIVYSRVSMCAHVPMCVHMCVCVCVCLCAFVYVCMYLCVPVYTYVCSHAHSCVLS